MTQRLSERFRTSRSRRWRLHEATPPRRRRRGRMRVHASRERATDVSRRCPFRAGRVSKMLDSTSQVSGSVWHMVDEFWLKRWRKFVLGRAARRYEPPGPITNEHLLESVARTRYLMEEGMTVEERKKRQKELDERATTVPPPIRREARLEFDQRSAAVEKYQTPLDEDSKEEPQDPEPATIGKHYRAINYDLWTYWRMVHGSTSRGRS